MKEKTAFNNLNQKEIFKENISVSKNINYLTKFTSWKQKKIGKFLTSISYL